MRYDSENNLLYLSVKEFVSTARRGISSTLPCDSEDPQDSVIEKETALSEEAHLDFTAGEYFFRLYSKTELDSEGNVLIYASVETSVKKPKKEVTMQARGEGYIKSFIYCTNNNLKSLTIHYIYKNKKTDMVNEVFEKVSIKELSAFFEKCKMSITVYAKPEIERVKVRLPSMKYAKFPYSKIREGQDQIIRGVYRNAARGGTLFICAPTGTGKTISVLFPAVRAIGNGKCEKVFYFTPKSTTADAAKNALEQLSAHGVRLNAVIISSKEKICNNGTVCRENKKNCKNLSKNRLSDAVMALYNLSLTVVGTEHIRKVAAEFCICPHELSLAYSELCDLVILDVNYLFSPDVYIRRFFSKKGNYAFLIDEAHNLGQRVCDIFTVQIRADEITAPLPVREILPCSPLIEVSEKAFSAVYLTAMKYLGDDIYDEGGTKKGATHLCDVPTEFFDIFDKLLNTAENCLYDISSKQTEDSEAAVLALKEYCRLIKSFCDAIYRFNSSYDFFIFLDGESIILKCFCKDPGYEIKKRLEIGSSAALFSATLSPIYYYKSILGADKSAEVIETESPFDSGQLSVSVMDKISTRYSERERTVDAVLRAIAATVSAKRGNYMVFSSSFEYINLIATHFKAKYPKIKTLIQRSSMTKKEKEEFIEQFKTNSGSYLVGFSVLGGIYSEGVDFSGESLIGAIIVGIGIPALSYEREAMAAYYQERFDEGKEFAYIYPGINKVLQAAGRVIRNEDERGVIVLIDDRFDDPLYKKVIPKLWSGMKFLQTPKELRAELDLFWQGEE